LPNSVGIDSASANEDVFKASGTTTPGKMSKEDVPLKWFLERERCVVLMSLPNSVGIDSASAIGRL
jgi:hypothetical protein